MNLQFSLLYRCSFLTLAAIGLVLILKKSQLHHGKTGNSWAALPQKKKFNEWVTSITLLSGISRGELLIEFVGKFSLVPLLAFLLRSLFDLSLIQCCVLAIISFAILIRQEISRRSKIIKKYREWIESEFSGFAETLALAVNSGLTFMVAITRAIDDSLNQSFSETANSFLRKLVRAAIGKRTNPAIRLTPLQRELQLIRMQILEGRTISDVLDEFSRRINSQIISDFVDAIVLSLGRGTPISTLITDHANSIRESEHRTILERASKAEIKMMVPVVFLLLPISVLFALWPSFQQLQQMVVLS